MHSVSFIFESGEYDDEFYALDTEILSFAKSLSGYAGKENWYSADQTIQNAIYYWHTKEALREFSNYATHLEAKRKYTKWYKGFQVVISTVEASYGDGNISHITQNL